MKQSFLQNLRCPSCAHPMRMETSFENNDHEIREGTVVCDGGHKYFIRGGIIDLLDQPDEIIMKEREGLKRFAQKMRSEGFKDTDLLTMFEHGTGPYWDAARLNLRQAVKESMLQTGGSLLDVGANNCWASAQFSVMGMAVTALDISDTKLQGLRSADIYMNHHHIYFERVMSTMTSLPFVDGCFDYVFCASSLHHNKPEQLQSTLNEIYRVLKPGGKLIAINEPTRGVLDKRPGFGEDVEEYEGNENIYSLGEYRGRVKRAGFRKGRLLAADSFYAMLTSERYARYAGKNIILKIGFRSFLWLWNHGLQRPLKFLSFQPIVRLFGGLPFNVIATK
jgi:SAM-dependent methyltransferase